jgi:voltage-gated potassium channel
MPQHRIENIPCRFGLFRSRGYLVLQYCVLTAGLVAMSAATIPDIRPELHAWLTVGLWCCLGFFTFELAVRLLSRSVSERGSSYLLSAAGVIDAMAVLPIPIAMLVGVPTEAAWLLASLWLLKLTTSVPGLSLLWRVISLQSRPLASVFVIFLIVLVLAAVSLHVLERAGQPEQFGSLPLSLWWAVTTLTTTGYGDAVPETFLGRVIAGIVMICGLGVFGLWTGILATGFSSEHRRRDFIRNWDHVTRVPFFSISSLPRSSNSRACYEGRTWQRKRSWSDADGRAIVCISLLPARSRCSWSRDQFASAQDPSSAKSRCLKVAHAWQPL